MSYWTRVAGYIDVSIPHNTLIREKVQKYVEWSIKELEKNNHFISGSEGDVKFNIIPGRWSGWSSEKYTGDTYDLATIFMNTNLRDRDEDSVLSELTDFVSNLQRFVDIRRININVNYKTFAGVEEWCENNHETKEDEVDFILKEPIEDKNGCDKLFKIQYHNWMRWNEKEYNNLNKIKEAVECLANLGPEKLEDVLNNSRLADKIDWDFNERFVDWQKYVGNEKNMNKLLNCKKD